MWTLERGRRAGRGGAEVAQAGSGRSRPRALSWGNRTHGGQRTERGGTGRAAGADPADAVRDRVVLVGGDAALTDAVAPVVAGAGLVLALGTAGRPWGYAAGAWPVLWGADEPCAPAPGAVLVDTDTERLWRRAALHPEHRCVVLPAGRAWLAERLACGGAEEAQGRVLAVAGVGEGACSAHVALSAARAGRLAGLDGALVELDRRDTLAALAGTEGRAGAGGHAGWAEAAAWAGDGAVPGLLSVLPRLDGLPVVAGDPGTDPREADAVLTALRRRLDLLVVHVGPLGWPPPPEALHGATELLVCAGAGAEDLGGTPPPTCAGSLVTVRSGWRPPDGPRTARALGCGWAGTVDVRVLGRESRSTRRLLRGVWAPRLRAGLPLGAAS